MKLSMLLLIAFQVALANPHQQAVLDYVFPPNEAEFDQSARRSDALVVYHQDQKVLEHYARGYTPDQPHMIWSVSKSVINPLVGIAVKKGLINLDDSVCDYLDAPAGFDCDKLKVRQLVTMTSNLAFAETYERPNLVHSSVAAQLYGMGQKNMSQFILDHGFRNTPNNWAYSSGDNHLVMAVVQGAYERAGLDPMTAPWNEFFNKIGMDSVVWERNLDGELLGCCNIITDVSDLEQFGRFFLEYSKYHRGMEHRFDDYKEKFNGDPLPADWHQLITELPKNVKGIFKSRDYVPGTMFRLNLKRNIRQGDLELNGFRPWPNAPSDMFVAMGHHGQFIFIIPSWDMFVIRLGDTKYDAGGTFDIDHFLALVKDMVDQKTNKKKFSRIELLDKWIPEARKIDNSYNRYTEWWDQSGVYYVSGIGHSIIAKELCTCLYAEKRIHELDTGSEEYLESKAHCVDQTWVAEAADFRFTEWLNLKDGRHGVKVYFHGLILPEAFERPGYAEFRPGEGCYSHGTEDSAKKFGKELDDSIVTDEFYLQDFYNSL